MTEFEQALDTCEDIDPEEKGYWIMTWWHHPDRGWLECHESANGPAVYAFLAEETEWTERSKLESAGYRRIGETLQVRAMLHE